MFADRLRHAHHGVDPLRVEPDGFVGSGIMRLDDAQPGHAGRHQPQHFKTFASETGQHRARSPGGHGFVGQPQPVFVNVAPMRNEGHWSFQRGELTGIGVVLGQDDDGQHQPSGTEGSREVHQKCRAASQRQSPRDGDEWNVR